MSTNADAERLRRLHLITDAALAHLQLDDLLDALLARTRDGLGVDTCALLMLDERTNELAPRAAVGLEESAWRRIRIPVGRGFAGTVAKKRSYVILDDIASAEVLNPVLREAGLKSLLGVPLRVAERVIGVLHVGTRATRRFDDEDVGLLQLVADRASIAIEHARLYEAERRTRIRLEQIQAITDIALAHLELDDLLRELLGRIREMLAADTSAVLLVDQETNELVARAAAGIEAQHDGDVRLPIGSGFAGRVAAARKPVVLEDVQPADLFNPVLRPSGIKSLLGAPLLVRGEVIGVVHVGTLRPRSFGDADVELLQLVADRVALAIERARVHTELRRLDQMKLNFVAVASHELRAPAAALYGMALTLRDRSDQLSHDMRESLEHTLFDQADRLRRLTEQLLDLSKLDAKAIPVAPRKLKVKAVVAEVAGAVGADGVEIRVPAELEAVADPLVVERVLTNLLVNAMRHGEPPVVVSAEQRDRHLRIAVEDAGPGVPDDLVPRLFERFERGGDPNGSGLGLAIARAYARAHGGDLIYDPTDGGARFEMFVPTGERAG